MPLHPSWADIAVRLICAGLAGLLIGANRSVHGRTAGLRTAMLVSLAACTAMILANLLMSVPSDQNTNIVRPDPMGIARGILTGMGFIGAAAIVRRDNLITGVTTAAALWVSTVIGLSFGGGQYGLGALATAAAAIVLIALKPLEDHMSRDHESSLEVMTGQEGPSADFIRATLQASGLGVTNICIETMADRRTVDCTVLWHSNGAEPPLPDAVRKLADCPGVVRVAWKPQAR